MTVRPPIITDITTSQNTMGFELTVMCLGMVDRYGNVPGAARLPMSEIVVQSTRRAVRLRLPVPFRSPVPSWGC